MKNIVLTILIVSSIAFQAQSQDAKKEHPIDTRLNECLDKEENFTTSGMMGCAGAAKEEWDKELNKYYQLLMKKLNDTQKESLKNAQRQWLKYRDSEYKFSDEFYFGKEGTMWRVIAVQRQVDIIKARTLELKDYFESFEESNY